ncbi:MAG TPA: beta-ketoacyl-ACP synthase III [Phycisphaerae bacterium]|nr:beta-ketoacyl-ACP synthase III [Phycisphaerae bacterium]
MSHPLGVIIRGMGASVPDDVLNNDFFASYLDTSDEWILPRTGIRERRRAAEGESNLTLALEASRRALQNAGMSADELDLIIVCTVTPETPLPSTACWLQNELGVGGMAGIPAFDLAAACSGFVYGLVTAGLMIQSGPYENALVIGVETLTRITDYQDRSTCILFGDGAGAAIVSRSPDPERRILYWELGADGSRAKAVWIPAGGSRDPASIRTVNERLHYMRMNGRELFKFAVLKMQELIDRTLEKTGVSADDIKLIIPHQSNRRIMESARQRVGVPPEKMAINIDRYGNTSAASIPLALDEAWRSGRVAPGDLVLLVAFGAGVTWGSVLMRL